MQLLDTLSYTPESSLPSHILFDLIILHDRSDLIQILHSFAPDFLSTTNALEECIVSNKANCFKTILNLKPAVEVTEKVLDKAAELGRLDLVKYLNERKFPCSTWAVDAAAIQGFTAIVEYLLTHRREGYTRIATMRAIDNGDAEMWALLARFPTKLRT